MTDDDESKKVTLLRRGYLVPPEGSTAARIVEIKSAIPRDYIVQTIKTVSASPKTVGDRVFIIRSATGSGKSITLPPSLLDRGKCIALTEPSRFSVDEITVDLGRQHRQLLKFGDNLGMQTGILNKSVGSGINVMTPGILRQHFSAMSDEELIRKYSTFMIDEVHRHDIMMDFLLRDIREFLRRNWSNKRCPILVVMSATMTPSKYSDYFESKNIIEVKGTSGAPITEHWPATSIGNLQDAIVQLAPRLAKDGGDTVVFLPTVKMITDVKLALQGAQHAPRASPPGTPKASSGPKSETLNGEQKIPAVGKEGGAGGPSASSAPLVVEVYSEIMERGDAETKQLATAPAEGAGRIILATNAAETGVTFPFLKNVIDTGMVFTAVFNPQIGSKMLYVGPVSKSAALQRRGRVGRRLPGDYYPLYTREAFDSMAEGNPPEIHVQDISDQLLRVIVTATGCTVSDDLRETKYSGQFDPAALNLINSPTSEMLARCMDKLYRLGFIDTEFRPTVAGWLASRIIQIPVEGCRLILSAVQDGPSAAMAGIVVACMASIGAGRLGASSFGACLGVYSDLMEQIYLGEKSSRLSTRFIREWCEERKMNYQAWMNTLELIDQTVIQVLSFGFDVDWNAAPDVPEQFELYLSEAFCEFTASWDSESQAYRLDSRGTPLKIKNEAIQVAIKNGTPPASIVTNCVDYRSGKYNTGDLVSPLSISYDRRFAW